MPAGGTDASMWRDFTSEYLDRAQLAAVSVCLVGQRFVEKKHSWQTQVKPMLAWGEQTQRLLQSAV